MIDELILHIGPAKTGTTTIQSALAATSPELRAAGVLVPLAEGAAPGQHLPILRELMDESEFADNFGFSKDVLSLSSVLAQAQQSRCRRLVISAEEFPDCPTEVLRLLHAIGPAKVVVVQAVRPVVPWSLSLFAQHVAYGLSPMSRWSIDRFIQWFADSFLPSTVTAVDLWRGGPWALERRVILLPHGRSHDVVADFSEVAQLPVRLHAEPARNQRLSACVLHVLQSLNLPPFDGGDLVERAQVRERVLAVLAEEGLPRHECHCGQALTPDLEALLAESFRRLVVALAADSDLTRGTVEATLAASDPDEAVHARFPDSESTARAAVLLHAALRTAVRTEAALVEARDFWHSRAVAFEEARDYWHAKVQELDAGSRGLT